jgi:hypothetical protein
MQPSTSRFGSSRLCTKLERQHRRGLFSLTRTNRTAILSNRSGIILMQIARKIHHTYSRDTLQWFCYESRHHMSFHPQPVIPSTLPYSYSAYQVHLSRKPPSDPPASESSSINSPTNSSQCTKYFLPISSLFQARQKTIECTEMHDFFQPTRARTSPCP